MSNKSIKIKSKYVKSTWDEYFSNMVELVGTRSTCDRGKSGCVIVKDKRILCTGYIGSPVGTVHCDEFGHEMQNVIHEDGTKSRHCVRTSHSEQNAIVNSSRFGIALDGSTLYCHMTPCYICAKMIINAGILRVVCNLDYHVGNRSKKLFKEAGVRYKLLNKKMESYKDM